MTKTITREQIKEKLDAKESFTIIEALPQKYFDSAHLPGALNIPHDEIQVRAPDLVTDKDAFIVVYCANTDCQNSKIATDTLQQMGYTNVSEYVEGKKHWLEGYFPIESKNKVKL